MIKELFLFRAGEYNENSRNGNTMRPRRGKDTNMDRKLDTREAIEKVLDALNDDPKLAEKMELDTPGTMRALVGGEVSEQDLANLTRGTGRIFSDHSIAMLFLKLLKNKKIRSGIVDLLQKVGGVSLLLKLLGKSKDEDDAESSMLSTLFGSNSGVSTILGLIGKKREELPSLAGILGSAQGGESGSLLGTILGGLGK